MLVIKGHASASDINVKDVSEVHQESRGKGRAVCLREANASQRVDVLAPHPFGPHIGNTLFIKGLCGKNLEGKMIGHTVSWDTMLSKFLYDGTDMCIIKVHLMRRFVLVTRFDFMEYCEVEPNDNSNPTFLGKGRALRVDNKGCGLRGPNVSDAVAPSLLVVCRWLVLRKGRKDFLE